jgi:hypothetical protein
MKTGDILTVAQGVIKKHNKNDKVYCKAGDKVKLIGIHGEILIVEGKERFSININQIQHDKG